MLKTKIKYVFFHENVIQKIMKEMEDNIQTETGGVLLGYRSLRQYEVTEMISPGPDALRRKESFEFDFEYVNSACNKYVSETNPGADLLGIWHKHIGRGILLSKEDIFVSRDIVHKNKKDIISGIMITYPEYRLMLYYIDAQGVKGKVKHNFNV